MHSINHIKLKSIESCLIDLIGDIICRCYDNQHLSHVEGDLVSEGVLHEEGSKREIE